MSPTPPLCVSPLSPPHNKYLKFLCTLPYLVHTEAHEWIDTQKLAIGDIQEIKFEKCRVMFLQG